MVSSPYIMPRDRAYGVIKIQNKTIGGVRSLSKTIDHNPQETTALGDRSIQRWMGAEGVSGRIERGHDITLDFNLMELATGKKYYEDGKLLIKPSDWLYSIVSVGQWNQDTSKEIWHATGTTFTEQSFIARAKSIGDVKIMVKKVGTGLPSGIEIRIYDGDTNTSLAIVTIPNADIPTSPTWMSVNFAYAGNILQVGRNNYWLRVYQKGIAEGDALNHILSYYNSLTDDFADGELVWFDGTSYINTNYDLMFQIDFIAKEKLTLETTEENMPSGKSDSNANINEGGLPFAIGDTTLTVTDGTKFKKGDWIQIESEILLVTNISTNDLTVLRGQLDTDAAEHADGLDIYFASVFKRETGTYTGMQINANDVTVEPNAVQVDTGDWTAENVEYKVEVIAA